MSRVQVLPFCLQKVMNTIFLYLSYVSPQFLGCLRVVLPFAFTYNTYSSRCIPVAITYN